MATNNILLQVSEKYATQDSLGNYTKTSEIRSKFALDPSSVTIESGLVTFKSDTLVIDSTNFKLSKGGAVTATGNFKTPGSLQSGLMGYARMATEGFKVFKYDSGADESSAVLCSDLNTEMGKKCGFLELRQDGNVGVRLVADKGYGLVIYNEDGSKSIFYANRDNANNGALGIRTGDGNQRFSVSTDSKGDGAVRIYGNTNSTTFFLWSDNAGNPSLRMYNTSGQEQVSVNGSSAGGNLWFGDGTGSTKSILAMVNGGRTGYFEKLSIGGSAVQDVHWIWSGTLQGWILTSSASLK